MTDTDKTYSKILRKVRESKTHFGYTSRKWSHTVYVQGDTPKHLVSIKVKDPENIQLEHWVMPNKGQPIRKKKATKTVKNPSDAITQTKKWVKGRRK